MAYVINKFSGPRLTILEDGTLDVSTSIGLVGRNYSGYGEVFNENFLFLLGQYLKKELETSLEPVELGKTG